MVSSMSVGLALGCSGGSIRTKAEAMKFAIEFTASRKEDFSQVFNREAAQEVFTFFCEHVELVDSDVLPIKEIIDPILELVKDMKDNQCKCSGCSGCKCKCKE